MSLATRCTACGTIFRVVQDQLKVSEGWVRCGRCQEVFSALEGLFDLEREAPPQRAETKPSATEEAAQSVSDFVASHHGEPTDFDPFADAVAPQSDRYADHPNVAATSEADAIESRFLVHGESAEPSLGAFAAQSPAGDASDDGFFSARFEADTGTVAADVTPAPGEATPSSLLDRRRAHRESQHTALASSMLEPSLDGSSMADRAAVEDNAPTSVYLGLDAQRSGWHSRGARTALSVSAVVLVGALLMQVAHQFRDAFATQWPQSRQALASLCEWTGCRIEPLRRLAAVTVEDSGLTQVQGSDAYRLSVTLHNRSAFEVALPSIDLSLTDGAGVLVSRRALAPADFSGAPKVAGDAVATLAPGTEAQLQALLASRGARVTGYTVELFYP